MNKSNEMGKGHHEAGWQASKMTAGEILQGKPKTVSHTVAKCGMDKVQTDEEGAHPGMWRWSSDSSCLKLSLTEVISN